MFWIYGGDLQLGDNAQPQYDGSVFAAEKGVIVVTINYRVSVFGFPNWDQISIDQRNVGFLDQRLALSFVHDNIAAFGGDPEALTIFGESAGGYSVEQLVALPPDPLSFRAAIMQSPAASSGTTTNLTTLAEALNCSSSEDALTCVREVDYTVIIDTIEAHGMSFYPVTDNVTVVNADGMAEIIKSGKSAQVPTIFGTNADEGTLFDVIAEMEESPSITGIPAPNLTESTGITLEDFQCPVSELTQLLAAQGLPVHRYFFNATFPNNVPYPEAGAFHTSEIPEVWGTFNTTGATGEQVQISKYMNTAWAAFAKNPYADPASDWPQVGNDTSQSNILNIQNDGVAALLSSDVLDALCKDLSS